MTPEQPERDLDKEFEDLIAHWDLTAPSEGSAESGRAAEPGPDSAGPPTPPDRRAPSAPLDQGTGPATPPPGVNVWRGPTVWRPPEEAGTGAAPTSDASDEDDFRPDPVVLPPQEDLHFWGIVVGLVGGGLLLLYVAMTGASTSSWWFLAAVGLFIGGFALLILRQPRDRDTTDDGTRL